METIGPALKKLREDRGLTIKDVAKRTRIRTEILRGIEEGDYHQISDGPFLRGFIRSYAQSLDLSEEEVERLLDSIPPPRAETVKQVREERRNVSWAWYGVAVLAALAIIVAVLLMSRKDEETPKMKPAGPPPAPVEAPPPSPVLPPRPPVTPSVVESGPTPQEAPPVVPKAQTKPQPPAQAQPQAQSQAQPPAASPQSSPSVETVVSKPVQLKVRVKESCWVRISLDGEVSHQALLDAGETRSWEARKEIRITLGNAGGVVLVVNGKEYENLGAQNEVIRDIAVTSEGLRLPEKKQ